MSERKPIGLSVPYRKVNAMTTRAELMEIARQTGANVYNGGPHFSWAELETFAKLLLEKHHAKEK